MERIKKYILLGLTLLVARILPAPQTIKYEVNVVGMQSEQQALRSQQIKLTTEYQVDTCNIRGRLPDHYLPGIYSQAASCSEINLMVMIGWKESGWRCTVKNPTSTAYGCFQWLDSSWKQWGCSGSRGDVISEVPCALKVIRRGLINQTWIAYWH